MYKYNIRMRVNGRRKIYLSNVYTSTKTSQIQELTSQKLIAFYVNLSGQRLHLHQTVKL